MSKRREMKERIQTIRNAQRNRPYIVMEDVKEIPTAHYIMGFLTGLLVGSAVTIISIYSWGVL